MPNIIQGAKWAIGMEKASKINRSKLDKGNHALLTLSPPTDTTTPAFWSWNIGASGLLIKLERSFLPRSQELVMVKQRLLTYF